MLSSEEIPRIRQFRVMTTTFCGGQAKQAMVESNHKGGRPTTPNQQLLSPPLFLFQPRARPRAQDDTCQTVTGIAVPAQQLRPDTWCRESCEKLGRVAAAAAVAAGGRGGGSSRDRAGTARMGDDGLRRCGRRRPPMFRPTRLARWEDGFGSTRPRGDVRGGPTARRKNYAAWAEIHIYWKYSDPAFS